MRRSGPAGAALRRQPVVVVALSCAAEGTRAALPLVLAALSHAPGVLVVGGGGGNGVAEKLDVEDLQNEGMGASYDGTVAYARDKRRQVAIAERLAERWAGKGEMRRARTALGGWRHFTARAAHSAPWAPCAQWPDSPRRRASSPLDCGCRERLLPLSRTKQRTGAAPLALCGSPRRAPAACGAHFPTCVVAANLPCRRARVQHAPGVDHH